MTHMIWRGLAALAIAQGAFWSGLVGFWTGQREPPIRVEALSVMTPVVEAGGTLLVKHHVARYERCELRIERSIVDADRVLFRLEDTVFAGGRQPENTREAFLEATSVPRAAAPGPARLQETLIHSCNPVHKLWPITQRLPYMTFEVVRPE